MAPPWTPDKVQKLLNLLRDNHDRLFVKSLANMQRKLQKDTFEMIASELGMPIQALRYKYFNLNNAYNTEMKKIEAANKQGFFYRPTLPWFTEYKEIMEKVNETCAEFEAENKNINIPRVQPEEVNDSEEELAEEEEEVTQPLSGIPSSNKIVVSIKQEYIDGAKKGSRDVDFEESFKPIQFSDMQQVQPALASSEIAKKSVKRQRKPESPYVSSPYKEDEFQLFANHVAEQLRNMTIDSARKMQSEIHIIFDEEGFPFDSPVLEDMT